MAISGVCCAQVSRLDEEKNALVARASQFQSSCMALGAQLKEARDRWQATCLTNAALQRELMALRAQAHEWQVRLSLSRLHWHGLPIARQLYDMFSVWLALLSSTGACRCMPRSRAGMQMWGPAIHPARILGVHALQEFKKSAGTLCSI